MLFRRLYDDTLAQASYLIGCQATGEAIVVDPLRDADLYIRAAEAERVHIKHVTETHIHADFASGSRELAHRTGAQLHLSGEGGEDWQYAFAAGDGARILTDLDEIRVGNVVLRAIHTPGHTPEHLSFLVTDGAATDEPMGILSGDFLFVGDVGRPDLLEKAAGVAGTMEDAARTLFRSIQRIGELPDHLQVWPGHGAGSACGKALGAVPSSTLGYERLVNPALRFEDEDDFVAFILEDQPEPPAYFAQMKRINRDGPAVLGHLPDPGRLGMDRLPGLLEGDVAVVDLRLRAEYARGHIPGTLNLPLDRSFTNWAGSLLPYDRPVVLLGVDQRSAREAARDLMLIGLDDVPGYLGPEVLEDWEERHGLQPARTVSPAEARELVDRGSLFVDVRGRTEWKAGRPAGAHHIHLGALPDRLEEIPEDGVTVLVCLTGARSAIAQSLLQATGRDAVNVEGGLDGWRREGLPVETGEAMAAAAD